MPCYFVSNGIEMAMLMKPSTLFGTVLETES